MVLFFSKIEYFSTFPVEEMLAVTIAGMLANAPAPAADRIKNFLRDNFISSLFSTNFKSNNKMKKEMNKANTKTNCSI